MHVPPTPCLVRASPTDDHGQRPQHQSDVLPKTPVHYVQVVELHHLFEGDTGPAEDLPVTRDPRREVEAPARPGLDVLVLGRDQWTRPDQTHLTADDVPQLWELVEAQPPEPPADPSDPWIVVKLEPIGIAALRDQIGAALLGVDGHRPELE